MKLTRRQLLRLLEANLLEQEDKSGLEVDYYKRMSAKLDDLYPAAKGSREDKILRVYGRRYYEKYNKDMQDPKKTSAMLAMIKADGGPDGKIQKIYDLAKTNFAPRVQKQKTEDFNSKVVGSWSDFVSKNVWEDYIKGVPEYNDGDSFEGDYEETQITLASLNAWQNSEANKKLQAEKKKEEEANLPAMSSLGSQGESDSAKRKENDYGIDDDFDKNAHWKKELYKYMDANVKDYILDNQAALSGFDKDTAVKEIKNYMRDTIENCDQLKDPFGNKNNFDHIDFTNYNSSDWGEGMDVFWENWLTNDLVFYYIKFLAKANGKNIDKKNLVNIAGKAIKVLEAVGDYNKSYKGVLEFVYDVYLVSQLFCEYLKKYSDEYIPGFEMSTKTFSAS